MKLNYVYFNAFWDIAEDDPNFKESCRLHSVRVVKCYGTHEEAVKFINSISTNNMIATLLSVISQIEEASGKEWEYDNVLLSLSTKGYERYYEE